MKTKTIILASSSPRRLDLLRQHGYEVEVHPAEIEETNPPHFTVGEITLWNARRKAASVAHRFSDDVVLAADTLVSHHGKILGKPRDLAEATEMLRSLNGQTHQVFSGVWLSTDGGTRHFGFIECSRVRFRKLTDREIGEYLSLINPLDKAGAYAAQHDPVGLIEEIDGSRTNVIGLPMEALAEALELF
ncbi:MAG: Maf family protein [Chthoniobacteraceae bacterium]